MKQVVGNIAFGPSLPLFDRVQQLAAVPATDPLKEREAARDAAFAHADDRWKEEYTAFILRFLGANGPATAENIRTAYESTNLPQTSKSKRASGAIFVTLKREGKIRKVGKDMSKLYGNELDRYELSE